MSTFVSEAASIDHRRAATRRVYEILLEASRRRRARLATEAEGAQAAGNGAGARSQSVRSNGHH